MSSLEETAIYAIYEALISNYGVMGQTKLASFHVLDWARNFGDLGKFGDFLAQYSNLFTVDDNHGPGRNEVRLLGPIKVRGDLYRPFDKDDSFVNDPLRLRNIINQRNNIIRLPAIAASLSGEHDAEYIFNRAYNKCARMTISVGYVSNHPDVTRSLLMSRFAAVIPENNSATMFVSRREKTGDFFLDVSVTFCGSDAACKQARESLRFNLAVGRISVRGKALTPFYVGYGPVSDALEATILEELQSRQQALYLMQQQQPTVQPTTPTPSVAAVSLSEAAAAFAAAPAAPPLTAATGVVPGMAAVSLTAPPPPPTTVPASSAPVPAPPAPPAPPAAASPVVRNPLPPSSGVWPVEYTYDGPDKRICDTRSASSAPSPLSAFINAASAEMDAKEARLRARCAEQRELPQNQRKRYANEHYCEWIAEPEFCLGKGTEATIYMGLFSDPANPDLESLLVAIKQSHDGTDPFNSQERQHLMDLKRQQRPGITQYHTSFEVEYPTMTLFILAQDIGLTSLRDLLSVKKVALTPEQKFKFTKALCMAVNDLHTECSVVHRDLRPENVLLMRDGKVCLADFGLSRKAEVDQEVKYTLVKRTQAQPYEVVVQYDGSAPDTRIPITHSGDVFMLGCVLAYLHQGRDPFKDNGQILKKEEPDLDPTLERDQPWLHHLLRSMLSHEVSDRPSCEYVLKHPYFQGHTVNTDLLRGIEFAIVMDMKPKDDHSFKALEAILTPLEQEMAGAAVKWHQQLPSEVFANYVLPFCDPRWGPLSFVREEGEPVPRVFPLPHLAQILRWHRNVFNHFSEQMQTDLRLTRGALFQDDSCYSSGGEFFTTHPAVHWLLPRIWTLTHQNLATIEKNRVMLIEENERRFEQFQRDLQSLAEQRGVTSRVLELSKVSITPNP